MHVFFSYRGTILVAASIKFCGEFFTETVAIETAAPGNPWKQPMAMGKTWTQVPILWRYLEYPLEDSPFVDVAIKLKLSCLDIFRGCSIAMLDQSRSPV